MGQLTFQATLGGAVNLVGPNTASTTSFTLPSADGTSGQALTTNGSGTLSFATVATSAATPTALGTVYGSMTTSGASPYLTALGYQAGNANTSGAYNVAVGTNALLLNTTGQQNVAIGYGAVVRTPLPKSTPLSIPACVNEIESFAVPTRKSNAI